MRMIITNLHDQVKSIEVANKKEGIVFTNFLCEQKYGNVKTRTVPYESADDIAKCIVSKVICDINPYEPRDNYKYNKQQKNKLLELLKIEERRLLDKIEAIKMAAQIIKRKKHILK